MADNDQKQPGEAQKLDLTSDKGQQKLDQKAGVDTAKEAQDLRSKALAEAKADASSSISTANINALAGGAGNINAETQKYLEEYFQGAIDKFDADPDGKISEKEAAEFRAKMKEKTKAIIAEVKQGAEKTQEMEKKAAKAESMKIEDVQKNLGEISEVTEKLDLAKSIDQFEKVQKQNSAFQQSIQNQITSIQEFGKNYAEFKSDQEGWSFFGYAAKKIFTSKVEQQQTKLQQDLDNKRNAANAALAELTAKKSVLDKNGEAIKAGIAAERARIIKERDEKLAEIEAEKSTQTKEIEEKQKKYKELSDTQKTLEDRRDAATKKQANNAEIQRAWTQTKAEEQWENRQKDIGESTKDAETELAALKILYDEPTLTPEAKDKVKLEMDAVNARLHRGQVGLKLADERIKSGVKIDRQLSEEEKAASVELNSVDGYLKGQVIPAKESLEKNISNMEQLKLQYSTDAETQVKPFYKKRVEEIDKIKDGVNEYVFASAVGRNKSIDALKKSVDSINSAKIESKSLWNPLNWVQAPLQGLANNFAAVAHWIDSNTGDLLKESKDRFKEAKGFWGKLGWGALHGVTQVLGVATGFVSGAVELVGGVFNMAAHPLDSLNGIGTLLGMNVKEGKFFDGETFVSAWKNLGKAVIGADELEKGNYGTAVGKFGFNVLSMFVGAGEVGAVGKAGEAAKLAQVAEVGEALSKIGKAAELAGDAGKLAAVADVAKLESYAAKIAAMETKFGAETAKLTQSAARAAYLKTFAKTVVSESVPQFVKDAAKAGSEKFGVVGKTWAVAKSLGGSLKDGVYAVGRGTRELFPSNIKNAFKSAEELAKTGGEAFKPGMVAAVYGNLLYAPVGAIRAAGRVAMDMPNLWKTFRGEGLTNAYRASKMADAGKVITAESAEFAKARGKIAEIIHGDAELSELAKTNESGLAAAEAKARIKLMKEEPDLAKSYSKMEKASEELQAQSKAIAKDSFEKLDKIKNEPQVKEAVTEHDRLAKRVAESEAADAAAANGAPKVDSPKTISAKNDLADFKGSEKGKSYKKYEQAADAEKELKAVLEKQQALFKEVTGTTSPELSRLEAEIGETRARYIKEGKDIEPMSGLKDNGLSRPPTQDSVEALTASRDRLVEAAKKGDAEYIKAVEKEFGPVEPGSALDLHLKAIREVATEDPVILQKRRGEIQKLRNETVANPAIEKAHTELTEALQKGNAQAVDDFLAKAQTDATLKPHLEGFKGEVLEYRANPEFLREPYLQHQDAVFASYNRYATAAREGDIITQTGIRDAHPEMKAAFDQFDKRAAAMDHNTAITHDIAASRIKADLIGRDVITEGMTAQEAADALSKRFHKYNKDLGIPDRGRLIKDYEVTLKDGKTYKVALEEDGKVRLVEQDGKIVPTSKEVSSGKLPGQTTAPMQAPQTSTALATAPQSAPLATTPYRTPAAPQLPAGPRQAPVAPTGYDEYIKLREKHADALTEKFALEEGYAGTALDHTANPYFNTAERAKVFNEYFKENKHHLAADELTAVRKEIAGNRAFATISDEAKLAESIDKYVERFAKSHGAPKRYGLAEAKSETALRAAEDFKSGKAATFDTYETELSQHTAITGAETKLQAAEASVSKLEADLDLAKQSQGYKDVAELKTKFEKYTAEADKAAEVLAEHKAKANNPMTKKERKQFKKDEIDLKQKADAAKALRDSAKSAFDAKSAATAEYAEATRLESELSAAKSDAAKFQAELDAAKNPVNAGAAPAVAPSGAPATAVPAKSTIESRAAAAKQAAEDASKAVEVSKEKLYNKQVELQKAEKNLQAAKDSREVINKASNGNDSRLAALDRDIAEAEAKVTGLQGEVAALEKEVFTARKEWGGALAKQGGYKLVDKLTSPVRSEWAKKQIARIEFVAGIPRETVRVLAKLLSEEGKAAAYATVDFFVVRGKKINAFLNNIFKANANAENLVGPLNKIALEQYIIMGQLSKAKSVTPGEVKDFSALSLPEKLAVLDQGWNKLAASDVTIAEMYNGNDKSYIDGKKTAFTSTIDSISTMPGATSADVTAALDQRFGPFMNDMGKSYEMSIDGITVRVAADGTRTYDGIDQWVANAPKRTAVSGALSDAFKKYPAMTKNELSKAAAGKPVTNAEAYRKVLSENIKSDIVGKLAGQDLSQPMTIRSAERTADGQPVFTATVNEKGQIKVDVNEEWSKASFKGIETNKPAPKESPKPSPKSAAKSKPKASAEPGPSSQDDEPIPTAPDASDYV